MPNGNITKCWNRVLTSRSFMGTLKTRGNILAPHMTPTCVAIMLACLSFGSILPSWPVKKLKEHSLCVYSCARCCQTEPCDCCIRFAKWTLRWAGPVLDGQILILTFIQDLSVCKYILSTSLNHSVHFIHSGTSLKCTPAVSGFLSGACSYATFY